ERSRRGTDRFVATVAHVDSAPRSAVELVRLSALHPAPQGLLLQVGVYCDALDIDGYARATTTLIDRKSIEFPVRSYPSRTCGLLSVFKMRNRSGLLESAVASRPMSSR